MAMSLVDESVMNRGGPAHRSVPDRTAFTTPRPFRERFIGLLVRSAVLALGLSLGGAGPLLGAERVGEAGPQSRTEPHPDVSPVKRPVWRGQRGFVAEGGLADLSLVETAHGRSRLHC